MQGQHPVPPPFPVRLRGATGNDGGVLAHDDGSADARAQLRSAISAYKSSGDEEALLEELHQALSQGLHEESLEVAETMKILWNLEKSRAEIESASPVELGELDDGGDGSDDAGASGAERAKRERSASRSTDHSRGAHRAGNGKPPPYPPPRQLQYGGPAGAGPRPVGGAVPFEYESVTPSFRATQERGSSHNFNSSFPGSAMSNPSPVRESLGPRDELQLPLGGEGSRQHSRPTVGAGAGDGSKELFLNQQLLEEQRSYVQHLRFLESERNGLMRLQDALRAGGPVSDNEVDLAQLNVLRASQAVRAKKEVIDTLHAMLREGDPTYTAQGEGESTLLELGAAPRRTNGLISAPCASGAVLHESSLRDSSAAQEGGSGGGGAAGTGKPRQSAGASARAGAQDSAELERLEMAVQQATQRLQLQRDELVKEFGREEAEQIVEAVLNNANMATTKYGSNGRVQLLAAALDDLEQAQTRRNEYFLVGKIFDRQMVVREIKRITNPKIAKISKIIKKLSTIFSDSDAKMDGVTQQQEKLADDIERLLDHMDGSSKASKLVARRMSKLETRVSGIYKLLGISEAAT